MVETHYKDTRFDQSKGANRDMVQNIGHQDVWGSPGNTINGSTQCSFLFALEGVYYWAFTKEMKKFVELSTSTLRLTYSFIYGQAKLYYDRIMAAKWCSAFDVFIYFNKKPYAFYYSRKMAFRKVL